MNNVIKKNLKIIFNFFPIILSIFLIKANINENKIIKDTSYENINKDLIIKNIDFESYSNYQEIIIDNGTAKQIISNITENYTLNISIFFFILFISRNYHMTQQRIVLLSFYF